MDINFITLLIFTGRRQRRILFGFDADRSDCAPKQKHRRKLLLVSVPPRQLIILYYFETISSSF